jgi:hypothetical protein
MPNEEPKFTLGPVNLLAITMLIGAVIGMLSLFLAWFSTDFIIYHVDYAGYDFLLRGRDYPATYPDLGYYAFMPLVVFAGAALALILSVHSLIKRNRKGIIPATVLGAVMFVCTVLYMTYPESLMVFSIGASSASIEFGADIRLMEYLSAGVYSAMIGSILLMSGGIILTLYGKTHPDVKPVE